MQIEADRVREQLEYRFGDDLRSVGYYDEDESDYVYIREDIKSKYDHSDLDSIFRDARLEAIDRDLQESLYLHGELRCTLRCFENAVELHLLSDQQKGVIPAVETGSIDDLQGTIQSVVVELDESNTSYTILI